MRKFVGLVEHHRDGSCFSGLSTSDSSSHCVVGLHIPSALAMSCGEATMVANGGGFDSVSSRWNRERYIGRRYRRGVHVLPLAYYVRTRVSWWRFVSFVCFDAGGGDAVSILVVSRTNGRSKSQYIQSKPINQSINLQPALRTSTRCPSAVCQ